MLPEQLLSDGFCVHVQINVYVNPETTSGGQALKFYCSMRLEISIKERITEAGPTGCCGNRVKVWVGKNKVRSASHTAV